MMARDLSTYRGARRNAAREDGQIRYWRLFKIRVGATGKLIERPKRGAYSYRGIVFVPYPQAPVAG